MKKFFLKNIAVCTVFIFTITQPVSSQISYVNASSATFPVIQFPARAIAADFDNDKDGDILYQTGANGSTYQYARSNGNGTFTIVPQGSSPFAGLTIPDNTGTNYYIGDFDRDGDIDLWFGGTGTTGTFFRNNTGTFVAASSATFPTLAFPARAIVADFDMDRDADILYQTGADGSPYEYKRNNGDGTFTLVPITSSPFAGLSLPNNNGTNYYLSDFDRDGDIDLWFGGSGTTGSYFQNNAGVFVASSSTTFPALAFPGRAIVGDYDSDSDGDFLYQTVADGSAYEYRRNNGNGTFTLVALASSPFAGLTIPDNMGTNNHPADYDGDSDLDLWFPISSTTGTYLFQHPQPPSLVSSSPADNANNVAINQNIVLTFNENVTAGPGNIYIRRSSDDATVETIQANGSNVTGSGTTTITIDPLLVFTPNTGYYLNFDVTAFRDNDNSSFGKYDPVAHTVGPIIDTGFFNFNTNTSVLSVNLINYNILKKETSVLIIWETLSETNADYFDVEYSKDGTNFTSLAKISSVGNNISGRKYSYTHTTPVEGLQYYRIVQYDRDGKKEVYPIQPIRFSSLTTAIKILPNPSVNSVRAIFNSDKFTSVQLIDQTGRVLAAKGIRQGQTSLVFEMDKFSDGKYYLKFLSENGNITTKEFLKLGVR